MKDCGSIWRRWDLHIHTKGTNKADTCLEHIQMNPLVREFWKQMAHIKIEQEKASEQERLASLQIPVVEG